ncbi:endonuclease III-like protein 1 [Copidosoma floridanum]|uniref:endonuclease III-like protein 1 n=1 Tax=Copidosoma floridanum TaxID=29053 RepID=UPI000C6F725B|nr:endonuclease III-like protein 1 [Copidosoma floridanum]
MDSKNATAWEPCNWEIQLNNIRKMRSNFTAPVDKMGCHKCADKSVSDSIFRYQTLIALMLSSQTKDEITFSAMQRLKNIDFSPRTIVSMPDNDLGQLIYPVGFWKVVTTNCYQNNNFFNDTMMLLPFR